MPYRHKASTEQRSHDKFYGSVSVSVRSERSAGGAKSKDSGRFDFARRASAARPEPVEGLNANGPDSTGVNAKSCKIPLRSVRNEAPHLHAQEFPALVHSREAVEYLVDLVPGLQLAHLAEPALDVGTGGEVAADDVTQRCDGGAEVVGNRELVAAEICMVRPAPVIVENLQPFPRALLAPVDRAGVRASSPDLPC